MLNIWLVERLREYKLTGPFLLLLCMIPFWAGSPLWMLTSVLAVQSLFPSATTPIPYQQTVLRPYVELFKAEALLHGRLDPLPPGLGVAFMKDETIQLGASDRCTAPAEIIGYCFVPRLGPPTILIDRAYWEDAEVEDRIELVMHELGHCALARKHEDSIQWWEGHRHPASFMHSSMVSGLHWWRYMDFYMDELFLGDNPDPLVW